jgi:hypothetical protein
MAENVTPDKDKHLNWITIFKMLTRAYWVLDLCCRATCQKLKMHSGTGASCFAAGQKHFRPCLWTVRARTVVISEPDSELDRAVLQISSIHHFIIRVVNYFTWEWFMIMKFMHHWNRIHDFFGEKEYAMCFGIWCHILYLRMFCASLSS